MSEDGIQVAPSTECSSQDCDTRYKVQHIRMEFDLSEMYEIKSEIDHWPKLRSPHDHNMYSCI